MTTHAYLSTNPELSGGLTTLHSLQQYVVLRQHPMGTHTGVEHLLVSTCAGCRRVLVGGSTAGCTPCTVTVLEPAA